MLSKLTKQELKVYNQLITALSVKQIAKVLGVSTTTIATHRNRIFEKLKYNDRLELVVDYYSTELSKLKQVLLDKGL